MPGRVGARVAVFVDAGYVLRRGALLAVGPGARRGDIECDAGGIVDGLVDQALGDDDARLLRCHWYDAAPGGRPTGAHQEIAGLADVKLRLGEVVGGRQRGVMTRIVHDILTLSLNGAVDTLVLVAEADELAESVETVQTRGIRVVRVRVPSPEGGRRNDALALTVDDDQELPAPFWLSNIEVVAETLDDEADQEMDLIGRTFAEEWLEDADDEEVAEVRSAHPRIPGWLDAELLDRTARDLSHLERRKVREAFWSVVNAERAEPVG